jgi:transcriptional regulator with XRE-family HTH domain
MDFRIKEICNTKDITMKELADHLGIAATSLSRSLNNNPTIETLEKIAQALDVPIIELFEASKEGFTALIDCNGILYRANSIEELKELISKLES